jgi:hypothetical protein
VFTPVPTRSRARAPPLGPRIAVEQTSSPPTQSCPWQLGRCTRPPPPRRRRLPRRRPFSRQRGPPSSLQSATNSSGFVLRNLVKLIERKLSPPMAASRLVGGAGRDTGSGQGQERACRACLLLLAKCAADCACAGALWARRAPARASSRAGPSAAAAGRQEPEDGGVPGWERRPGHARRGL